MNENRRSEENSRKSPGDAGTPRWRHSSDGNHTHWGPGSSYGRKRAREEALPAVTTIDADAKHAGMKKGDDDDEFSDFDDEQLDDVNMLMSHVDKATPRLNNKIPREIDETSYTNNDTPEMNSKMTKETQKTSRSLFSNVIQSSSSAQSNASPIGCATTNGHLILESSSKSNYRVEERDVNTITNIDGNEDSNDGENDVVLSLDQLTQEEVDFDAMLESEDSHTIEMEEEDEKINSNNEGSKTPELKQPTLSQYYSKEEQPNRAKPKIANFAVCDDRHYFKGDVWQHVTVPPSSKNSNRHCSNLIVTVTGTTTEKREQVATVENKFYLPIENVPWLGDNAQSVLQNRRRKGSIGPEFVEFKLRTKSVPRFPLRKLQNRITIPVMSDLVFGYDDYTSTTNSTKASCFFKYLETANTEAQIPIPKNAEGKFTALELYSGAGGFSLGLKNAGFCVTHHVDNDTAACSTLRANFPESRVIQSSVADFLKGCIQNPTSERYPKDGSLALLHGSSPCQGFSSANRNGGANDLANNAETFQFIEVVRHFQTPFVTFENVEGITKKKHSSYVEKMIAELLKMDYQVRLCFVTASDYGDPQDRDRVFILAAKKGLELPHLPPPTHGDGPSLSAKTTVADAIGFLEEVIPLEYEGDVKVMVNGVPMDLEGHIVRSSRENKDDIELTADAAAPTVIKRRVIRHYGCNKRPLTRLERSLLQSFPCTYEFGGTDSEIRDQIGNAVPVCLARAIGKSVMDAIRRSGR